MGRLAEVTMGSKFADYAARVERDADVAQRDLLDAFGTHFEEERRLHLDVAAMLASARHRAGLSQVQLAEQSGVGQSEISRIENGQANPTLETLDRLAGPLMVRLIVVDEAGQPITS